MEGVRIVRWYVYMPRKVRVGLLWRRWVLKRVGILRRWKWCEERRGVLVRRRLRWIDVGACECMVWIAHALRGVKFTE